MLLFHIDLTLMVAMVTQNGHQNRLNLTKCHFRPEIGGFIDKLFNFQISAQLNTKKYFNILCMLLISISYLNIVWYLLVVYVNLPVKPPNFGPKCHFFYSSLV